jgi:hypothetical protein
VFQTVKLLLPLWLSPYFPFKISRNLKKKGLLSKISYDLQHNEILEKSLHYY